MLNYLEFIQINLSIDAEEYVQVNEQHLQVFGINPKLAPMLRLVDSDIRAILAEDLANMDHIILARHMATPLPGSKKALPMNQCVRWQLMRYTLGELQSVGRHFGCMFINAGS